MSLNSLIGRGFGPTEIEGEDPPHVAPILAEPIYYPDPYSINFGFTSSTISATGSKIALVGRVHFAEGEGSKSIRAVALRFGSVTKSGGSGLTVSLQDVDASNGPVAQPDETQDQTVAIANGDSGFDSNLWYETGNLSSDREVEYGEMLAVVIEFDGSGRLGSDSVVIQSSGALHTNLQSLVLTKTSGVWAAATAFPNILLKFSDGTYGRFLWSIPFTASAALTVNTTTNPDEVGMRFQLPFACTVSGGWAAVGIATDCSFVLYDGTTAIGSVTIDVNQVLSSSIALVKFTFDAPVELEANHPYILAFKPEGSSPSSLYRYTGLNVVAEWESFAFGQEGYFASRVDAGAWSYIESRRPAFGLAISALEEPVAESTSTGDPPDEPTLAIDTGAPSAAITGSTAGTTNTLYAKSIHGGSTEQLGSRTGDGSISFTLADGTYVFWVQSADSGGQSLSNLVIATIAASVSASLEPYAALLALIESQATLIAALGSYARSDAADVQLFPKLVWSPPQLAAGDTDIESVDYHRDLVQFDLFGEDEDELHELADLVDRMDGASGGILDTVHYRGRSLSRISPWRRINWQLRQTASGNNLLQLSSDWMYVYARRQNIA